MTNKDCALVFCPHVLREHSTDGYCAACLAGGRSEEQVRHYFREEPEPTPWPVNTDIYTHMSEGHGVKNPRGRYAEAVPVGIADRIHRERHEISDYVLRHEHKDTEEEMTRALSAAPNKAPVLALQNAVAQLVEEYGAWEVAAALRLTCHQRSRFLREQGHANDPRDKTGWDKMRRHLTWLGHELGVACERTRPEEK